MAEVNVENLRPNSHTYKEQAGSEKEKKPREKMKAIIKKDAVVSTKKPLKQKFAELFIKEDVKDIKGYLIKDVLIPGAKNLILDGLGMLFFGELISRGRRDDRYYGRGRGYGSSYTNYNSYYRGSSYNRSSSDRGNYYEENSKIDYRHIVLRNRDDAEAVIDQMQRRIEDQGSASIADLFDLIDVAGQYTDNNWGWTDPREIGIRRIAEGFLIDVAEARYLN